MKESQLLHIELWYIKVNDIMEFYMRKFQWSCLLLYNILQYERNKNMFLVDMNEFCSLIVHYLMKNN
jgi:hypothetical protein